MTSRESSVGDENIARPDRIIVQNFAATPADVADTSAAKGQYSERSTPQTAEQIEVGRQLGAQLAQQLAAEIRKMGLPAVQVEGQPPPRVGDVVLSGEFVSVEEGAAGKRVLVGFGSGAAKLQTVVEGHLMTDQGLRPLESRGVAARGGKTPGVLAGTLGFLVTGSPIGLIAGGAFKLTGETRRETIAGMARMSAKEIAEELRVVFEEHGWI